MCGVCVCVCVCAHIFMYTYVHSASGSKKGGERSLESSGGGGEVSEGVGRTFLPVFLNLTLAMVIVLPIEV